MASDVQRPTDAEVIAILVQAIKHSHLSVKGICSQLKKQGVRVKEQAVLNLFADHGIVLKKTPRSPS
jgi:transposase